MTDPKTEYLSISRTIDGVYEINPIKSEQIMPEAFRMQFLIAIADLKRHYETYEASARSDKNFECAKFWQAEVELCKQAGLWLSRSLLVCSLDSPTQLL